MHSGLVFDIQKFCVQDGPGIRTTVFLKGCPLDCVWCHNPESRAGGAQILWIESRCIQCGHCVEVCPLGAALTAATDDGRCLQCGACVEACPAGARQQVGTAMGTAEVLAQVLADRSFYEESGGGVTFSGGEPLQQPEFLLELLAACRAEELHTAVDTSGAVATAALLAAAPLTSLFLYDVKVMDDARHRQFVGASNTKILANLRALSRVHDSIWLRLPLIPGINDDAANLDATAALAAELPGVRCVQLLPYHKSGAQKFERVGRRYQLADLEPPSAAAVAAAADRFVAAGLPVLIGERPHERPHRAAEA